MDEHAIVLKYLELRAEQQRDDLERLSEQSDRLLEAAVEERLQGQEILSVLGLKAPYAPRDPPTLVPGKSPVSTSKVTDWLTLRSAAVEALKAEGLDPTSVRLPASEHRLDVMDIASALACGAIGAILPSLGSRRGLVSDALAAIQRAADTERLPDLIQTIMPSLPLCGAGRMGRPRSLGDGAVSALANST